MERTGNTGFESRRVFLGQDAKGALARILPELRRGGVVLLPADTIYGLSCRWDSERARERIQAMKGPGRLSLFVALVGNLEMALRYAEPPGELGMEVLRKMWPGPFTAVLQANPVEVPPFCIGPDGTVAFRWPRDPFLEELVRDLGVPLVSTSANRTGEAHARSAAHAWDLFGAAIDLYIDVGDRDAAPSTLVDLTSPQPRLLRLGVPLPEGILPDADGCGNGGSG